MKHAWAVPIVHPLTKFFVNHNYVDSVRPSAKRMRLEPAQKPNYNITGKCLKSVLPRYSFISVLQRQPAQLHNNQLRCNIVSLISTMICNVDSDMYMV